MLPISIIILINKKKRQSTRGELSNLSIFYTFCFKNCVGTFFVVRQV